MTVPLTITGIDATIVRTPYAGTLEPAWSPGAVWRESSATIYRVHTDAGITGVGAARGNPEIVRTIVAPLLTGADPARIEPIVRTIINAAGGFAAIPVAAGIEMALWDAMGKAAGLPLYRLWGAHADRIRAYASMVEVRTPERRAEDARMLLERGYTAIKLRLHDETMRQDLAQVEAVRTAVGDRMTILVDANQAQEPGTPGAERSVVWGYDRAVATARELYQMGVAWLEEPLPRYDFDNQRRLAAATDLPIAGGENNVGLHEFRTLIDTECYDVLQPDALVCGGIGLLRKVAAYAEMHGKPIAPHHGGNGLGVATHLHLSASLPNAPWVELLQDPPAMEAAAFQGILATPLVPDADGFVQLPEAPGLGVELAEHVLAALDA